MDQTDIIYRKCQKGDEAEVVDLLEYVFDRWPKVNLPCSKTDYWTWKYRDRPIQDIMAAVALHKNKIIGCLHAPYVNLKVKGNMYICENGGDLAVHPDYRGKGVWRAMVEIWNQERKSPDVIGYSNSSTAVLVNRVKSRKSLMFPSPVKHYCRIKNIDEFLEKKDIPNSMVKKMGYIGLSSLAKLRNLGKRKPGAGYSMNTIKEFDERIDELWNTVQKEYELIVERRKDYLNWRYCDPRGGEYTVKTVEENDRILGYSVLRINKQNTEYPEGYIVDLLTTPNKLDAVDVLLEDACKYFDKRDIGAVHIWVPRDHAYLKITEKHGFLDSQTEIVVWFGDEGTPKILETIRNTNKEKVFFQLGDVDWI